MYTYLSTHIHSHMHAGMHISTIHSHVNMSFTWCPTTPAHWHTPPSPLYIVHWAVCAVHSPWICHVFKWKIHIFGWRWWRGGGSSWKLFSPHHRSLTHSLSPINGALHGMCAPVITAFSVIGRYVCELAWVRGWICNGILNLRLQAYAYTFSV